ncbi:MAG TPA: serine/threonine-protein kinase [Thermoanaerobaculia bacterium]
MRWISNDAIGRLRRVADAPDFSGTRYRVIGELARGGMGVVYEAEDTALGRHVALKVLASELTGGSERLADHGDRMRREAQIVARLEHPGIVPVHDVGVLPDGRLYYAMKLVRGTRLDAWAHERPRTEVLLAFVRVCEAVAFANANGVVHGDLKPDNVMVGEFGEVLVMDWGVARRADEDAGVIAGTRGFMAPEQERGEAVDARADVFALGAMLAALTDNRPRPLAAIATKATARERSDRYASARELAADVLRFVEQEPLVAYRENVVERTSRWLGKHRALVALILAYLVMRALVLFIKGF